MFDFYNFTEKCLKEFAEYNLPDNCREKDIIYKAFTSQAGYEYLMDCTYYLDEKEIIKAVKDNILLVLQSIDYFADGDEIKHYLSINDYDSVFQALLNYCFFNGSLDKVIDEIVSR